MKQEIIPSPPPTTILVVDDDLDILTNVKLALETEGYQILTAQDGLEALALLHAQSVHLILADIAMSPMNGYQLFERVRQEPKWVTIPFMFLTARAMDSDIRYGKELGVDDYLTKPFRVLDLLAAVRGKLRRAKQLREGLPSLEAPSKAETHVTVVGRLRIDSRQHRAWLGEEELKLSVKEFKVLEYLAQRKGKIVPPQELIQVSRELKTDYVEAGLLLRPLILSVRRKLGVSTGEMGVIENVRGMGYRLTLPE
ncbi:MAG: response regulator transcription factor [Anaerolineae bacterium]|nr:response regulator transcription factor [Anaerolineae bacterium]